MEAAVMDKVRNRPLKLKDKVLQWELVLASLEVRVKVE